MAIPSDEVGLVEQLSGLVEEANRLDETGQEVRLRLLLAQVHDIFDDQPNATKAAEAGAHLAECNGYRDIAEAARAIATGRSRHQELVQQQRTADENPRIAFHALSDEALEQMAWRWCDLCRLPDSRHRVVLRESKHVRELHRQRLSWCRHLSFLEKKGPERNDPSRLYQRVVSKVGFCERIGKQSQCFNTKAEVALRAFKITFCRACEHRAPAVESSDASS